MDSSKEQEIEARLAKIENAITSLQRSVDGLAGERRYASPGQQSQPADPLRAERMRTPQPRAAEPRVPEWLSSRSPEWWLSRLGAAFVVLAVLILYGYAVDKGWITPPIRVLAGSLVGAALVWAGHHTERPSEAEVPDLGMRELLYGAGLGVWFVTVYAASVWYQMMSSPSARLLYFGLGLVSTWIALEDRREIFAVVAIATGFATPFILPPPYTSVPEISLYLGAISGVGLIIYLMRGWPAIIWLTFAAFWFSIMVTIYDNGVISPIAVGSTWLSFVLLVSGAAFTRVPSLRRRLLALGSDRYIPAPVTPATWKLMDILDSFSQLVGGGKSASDSHTVWVITILSPMLTLALLGDVWPNVPVELWGVALLGFGWGAYALARRGMPDEELQHVAFAAAALWTLVGAVRIIPQPERLAFAALHATFMLVLWRQRLVGPRTIAKATIVVALLVVLGRELSGTTYGLLHARWVISELIALGASGLIARKLIADPAEKIQGAVLGAATYMTSLLVIANILQPIWPPLITATFAALGAVLLILSRRGSGQRLMRQLGGVTMVLVVGRLLLVDLATVETIWRVLLFLLCGVVFLYTGYRLQPARVSQPED
ncbi:MAG TPA: DUF2339 domain-containing protein [Gemmatimonadaceae bacterium]